MKAEISAPSPAAAPAPATAPATAPAAAAAPPRSGALALAAAPRALAPAAVPTPVAIPVPGGPGAPALPPPAAPAPRPAAGPARLRRRHRGAALAFLVIVVLPVAATAAYLWLAAQDQYASRAGFAVRREEIASAADLLGGITRLSGSTGSDTDVLFDFIRSQPMVRLVDDRLDLRRLYAVEGDPVFALRPDAGIEDLTAYWRRMVRVDRDGGNGLIALRVQAFAPEDARAVARAIVEESTAMINRLSNVARQDATRHARNELDGAADRLSAARQALTEFRARSRIVDPAADIQGRMVLLAGLEGQLTEALIDLDILRETTRASDPRIAQADRRVRALEARIAAERDRFGLGNGAAAASPPEASPAAEGVGAGVAGGGAQGGAYATLVADYERLSVEVEFAEASYLAARGAYEAALAEAQRQSRYLAAHVEPTLAERAEYPRRAMLTLLVALAALIAWAILTLGFYSLRDRR